MRGLEEIKVINDTVRGELKQFHRNLLRTLIKFHGAETLKAFISEVEAE